MSRPEIVDIQNGLSGWDGVVNDNYRILRESFPFPQYADLATLTSARLPAQNEGCAAAVENPSWAPYWCDGTAWIPWLPGASIPAHAPTHESGGVDEINVTGLSGLLATPQTAASHAATHESGGADEINVTGLSGLLSTPQTPANHGSTHNPGGADAVSTGPASANPPGTSSAEGTANSLARQDHTHALPAFGSGSGTFCEGDDPRLSDARLPLGYENQSTPGPLSTTSVAFVTLDTFTPGSAPYTGTWRLGFRCEFNSDVSGEDIEVELRRLDGGAVVLAFNEEEPADPDDWNTFAHFEPFVLAPGSPSFDVRARRVGGAATVTIRRVQWEWQRVL